MLAGAMDRRMTLQRFTETRDAFNEPVRTWADLATVWASKQDVRDSERLAAAQAGATITTRFQVRWSSGIADLNPKDRLTCEGRTYSIVAVKEIGRREGLEISAVAEAD